MLLSEVRQMMVKDLMDRWPQTVEVFVRRRMNCPGCLMAPFMTVAEAAEEYGEAAEGLVRELLDVIEDATAGEERLARPIEVAAAGRYPLPSNGRAPRRAV